MYKQRVGINAGVTSHYTLATRLGGLAPTLSLDFLSGSLDSRVTFTRGTTATFVGSNGLIQSAAINTPRFDYDPVTLNAKGLLIEEQRTNLFTRSEEFDNAAWIKSEVTVTANSAVSPDGASNAEFLVPSVNAAAHQAYQSIALTNATAYTVTVYAKSGGYNFVNLRFGGGIASEAFFDLSNGTVVSATTLANASIRPAGNGWYRCSYTATATSTASFAVSINPCPTSSSFGVAGNGTSGVYVYGAQLEAGAFATSYIPTVASQVTRSADVATMTGTNFSSWYNGAQGTLVTETRLSRQCAIASTIAASANDGTSANALINFYRASGNTGFQVNLAGFPSQANINNNVAIPAETTAKIGSAYGPGDFAMSTNGGATQTVTGGTVPTVNRFDIGQGVAGVAINGHIRRIAYYPQRLPNTTLQRLTA